MAKRSHLAPSTPGWALGSYLQSCPALSEFRILIVDWDVHHGQGIQYIFDDDPR